MQRYLVSGPEDGVVVMPIASSPGSSRTSRPGSTVHVVGRRSGWPRLVVDRRLTSINPDPREYRSKPANSHPEFFSA